MTALVGNSVFCRPALKGMHADTISFSSIRLVSGAIILFLFTAMTSDSRRSEFRWLNVLLLCVYVFSFSIAYISLSTGADVLLLFDTVQLVMAVWGIAQGGELIALKITGILGALVGIVILLFPSAERPSFYVTIMMVIAGLAQALYSVTGKKITDAAVSAGGNFILAIPAALIIPLFFRSHPHIDMYGLVLGMFSGATMSGDAYLLWYSSLLLLRSTTANTIQLSVSCLAALGGIMSLGGTLTVRAPLASVITLARIGLTAFSDMREEVRQTD